MIDELQALNERFYEIASRQALYAEKLSDAMNTYLQEKILEQYKLEYQLLDLEANVTTKTSIYNLTEKCFAEIPQERRIWWQFFRRKKNTAALLYSQIVAQEAEKLFREIEKKIAENQGEIASLLVEEESPTDETLTEET